MFSLRLRLATAVLVITLGIFVLASGTAVAGDRSPGVKNPVAPTALVVQDLSGPLTGADLASALVGTGVAISNVTYDGADVAAGSFTGGDGIIGFNDGILLSSGAAVDVVGPNQLDNTSTSNSTPGDVDLEALSGFVTLDAAVLEFDFVPDSNQVFFRYVFTSEEYNEFVNSSFNDVFGFFVNGTNCAVVGGDPVSINAVNNGNPYNTDPRSNPQFYINNDLDDGGGAIDTEMDGLTVVLNCAAAVNANQTNHLKLAIADASDSIYDSAVFIEAGSLTTTDVTFTGLGGDQTPLATGGVWLGALALLAGGWLVWRRRTA